MYNFNEIVDRKNTGAAKWNEVPNASFPPLTTADMEWKTCKEIIEALEERALHGIFGYTKPDISFYQSIINWIKKRHQYEVQKEEIICTNSVIPAIMTSIRTCSKKGDGVILFTPGYTGFFNAVSQTERKIIECPLIQENGIYQINFEDFLKKAKVKSNTILLFCNPHNPVGRVFTKEELKQVEAICLENDLKVITDEIHADIILEGKHLMFAGLSKESKENTITCMSPSKTFNLAGLQTAYCIISNEEIREKFRKQLEESGHRETISAFGYTATIAAYEKGELWLTELIYNLKKNLEFIQKELNFARTKIQANSVEGTYLAWLDFKKCELSQEKLVIYLFKNEIYLTDGRYFGKNQEGFFRMNFALPYSILEEIIIKLTALFR